MKREERLKKSAALINKLSFDGVLTKEEAKLLDFLVAFYSVNSE